MAEVILSRKACAENPLKSSTPLGAALAFLGVEGAVPLFHGSQGCTSFALVLAVRHFKETIPFQTTAMNEVSTVLGGRENLEEALINIQKRMKPKLIGVASTALVETRGEDFAGDLATILARRQELAETAVVFAATPDFSGALEDGWAKATSALILALVERPAVDATPSRRINVLPGVHQTAADIDELRETIRAFELDPIFLPDISGSLDGHVPDGYVGTSLGGTSLGDLSQMGQALATFAVGEHMRAPAQTLFDHTGVPFTVFSTLTGLAPSDEFIQALATLSGQPVPPGLRRRRSQLVDALLDSHFYFAGKRLAIGADPDLLWSLSQVFAGLGAEIVTAVVSTPNSPLLADVPCSTVVVGDLADLEDLAKAAKADLLITHSHGRQAAERLDIPLYRVGFPIFDRVGNSHRSSLGYTGTRQLVLEVANLFCAELEEPTEKTWALNAPAPSPIVEETTHVSV